jgi:hypothetical protein
LDQPRTFRRSRAKEISHSPNQSFSKEAMKKNKKSKAATKLERKVNIYKLSLSIPPQRKVTK